MRLSYDYRGPRERLLHLGPKQLSDAELLALLLGTGSLELPVEELAIRILSKTENIQSLAKMTTQELSQFPGVGIGKATRIVAAIELGTRIHLNPIRWGEKIKTSNQAYQVLKPVLGTLEVEEFWALPLDAQSRTLGLVRISSGGLTSCPVHPSDAFRPLIRKCAHQVVFAHNHPSGSLSPSQQDIQLTRLLRKAGFYLGIEVCDHVILSQEGYFSFLDENLLLDKPADGPRFHE